MKQLLLAAALIAAPALAQQQGSTGTGSPTSSGAQTLPPTSADGTAPTTDAGTPPADPSMTGQTTTQQAPMSSMPQSTGGNMTAGGYQPSGPATTGQPGGPVVFQQAADPNTAYPPPAPLAKYPVCKKGQYDKCMQRGGR